MTIAHAFGGIDGISYTNSLEAFIFNYQKGHRTFEVDFCITSDNQLVCFHDWDYAVAKGLSENGPATEEYFLSHKIDEKYTTVSLRGLFSIMKSYPDVWIVTDTKDSDEANVRKCFEIILKTATEEDAVNELERFIVQFYNKEMFKVIDSIHHFNNYIFTLYQLWNGSENDFVDYAGFCKENGVAVITMWWYLVNDGIMETAGLNDIKIYVHTVNDLQKALELKSIGVKGFYTDFLTPDDFK